MQVLKFGGTSVQDYQSMQRVIAIVSKRSDEKVIVVSALAGVTNALLDVFSFLKHAQIKKASQLLKRIQKRYVDIAEEAGLSPDFVESQFSELHDYAISVGQVGEFSPQSQARLITFGDRMAAQVLQRLMAAKLATVFIDSSEFLESNLNFLTAEVNLEHSQKLVKKKLLPLIQETKTVVVPGFVAANKFGQITALGRGGSDYSAACIANCLKADVLEIWTDVDGVMTCDPRRVKEAKPVRKISYLEAQELAYFGGKVLHPKTIQPAYEKQIPIHVRNTMNTDDSGTLILPVIDNNNRFKAITCKSDISVITIHSNRMLGAYGFLSKVFEVFEQYQTSIDLIATSEVSISLTIDNTGQ
ncbi:MAG: aspartate kinase, partial [Calditrichaeota bacterium]|nr:aspartate kinase [Calditrichota bacterium]